MQSSYWRNSINSSRAVDGRMNTKFTENSCIHTGIWSSLEWWQVDLGRNIYIHKLAIYFRTDVKKRRKGVTVYSSVADKQTNTGHPCGTATLDSPDVTWMICNSTARYITLYRDTYGDKAMDFCEVQVFICDAGTFGDDCSQFCHCGDGPCNYVTGNCSGECKPNWTGQTCSECDSDHYGPLCEKPCFSRHCDESGGKSSCNKTTGRCVNGCTAGWKELDCTKECSEFTYGVRCANNCRLRNCFGNSDCDHVTGKCDHGCDRGYQSEDCTTMCPSGRYGYNCNMSCEERKCARNSVCDRYNGTCDSGCLKGWELPDCTTNCRHNTFGPNCLFNCTERHCKGDNSKCDAEDGNCQDGCQPGWKNANCTEKCDESWYGTGCVFKCNKRHCQNKAASCNHVDGSCGGECENNYRGTDCTECDVRQYGPECNSSCSARHCKANDESCDHVTGSCSGPCEAGWQGDDCTLNIVQTAAPDENPGPIIGGVIGTAVVVVVVTVVVVVFLRRRKRAKDDTKDGEPIVPENKSSTKERTHHEPDVSTYVNVELSSTNSAKRFEVNKTFASAEVPVVTTGDVALVVDQGEAEVQQPDEDEEDIQDTNTYYNDVQLAAPSFSLPEEGFDVTELEGIIESIRNQPGGFQAEYVKLPSGFSHPYNDSQIPENRCKNRYAGYYPYDNNRVKLSALPNSPHSDYINASYVDAYEKQNYFIAAQAPNKDTLPDFWRMIWEQDCGQIVMLTNLVEAGKHKCVPYWRDSGSMKVGYFVVVVKDVTVRADYITRKIQITQTKSKKCKTFDHYHFTSWPDHGVPKVLDLLEFFWLTRETPLSRPGPVLVHCSAGIGRTGTYIALHILTDEMKKTGRINILEMMTKIRDQRKNMVQTKNQYECIFTTMLEVVEYGQTSMTTSAYQLKYAELNGSLNMGKKTLDELAEVIASTDTSDTGLPLKNQLWVDGKNDLFVVQAPSKLLGKGYLLVYSPQKTANLLWKLIMENDSLTLVTLGNKNDGKFIPSPSQSSVYGKVTVTSVTETYVSREITLRILNAELKGSDEKKEIANFSVQSSSNMNSTSTVISYLTTLTEQILDRQTNLKFHPVTVVFDESDKKEGLSLCILNNIMSAVSLDKRVEIFNNVRRLQSVLPSLQLSVNDFKLFCDLPFAQLESTGVYVNM